MDKLRRGIIAVTGVTAAGKSQLAIDLARAVNGEVINADALQVYRGYDIITNKVSTEEMSGIPHHLLGFVEPTKEYTVQQFEKDALEKIEEIHQRNHIPILAGGTNYYIQAVLFSKSLISSRARDDHEVKGHQLREFEAQHMRKTNQELWDELWKEDPIMAENWHKNNRRKVLRSLEVLYTTGKRHSEWIKESEQSRRETNVLRFPSLVFWLHADKEPLDRRLNNRVDKMIKRGLFGELEQLARDFDAHKGTAYTSGLRQAIGFREFHKYLNSRRATPDELEVCKIKGTEDMKSSTRKYAKRQVAWIRNKLVPECRATLEKPLKAHTYVLDATDLSQWDAQVREKGVGIAKSFVDAAPLPDPLSLSAAAGALLTAAKDKPNSVLTWKRHRCDVCSKTASEAPNGIAREVLLNGDDEYKQHLNSRQHKKNLSARKHQAKRNKQQQPPRKKPNTQTSPEPDSIK